MTKFMKYLILSAGLSIAAFGQTATTSTTFSSAVSDRTVQVVNLTSATNVSAGGYLYADGETMTVKSTYVSGTAIPVNRGGPGTRAVPHLSSGTVYVFAPGDQARSGLINYDLYGGCTRTDHTILPRINQINGRIFDCFASFWYYTDTSFASRYSFTIAPGAQPAATSATAGSAIAVTGQAGGAQSATTSGGAAGGAATVTGGIGGVGGTSSGTGGAGGAVGMIGGAGAGTVTGGVGGLATVGGGAGANGSGAGGTGGGLNLYSGAKGTGGTGVDGAVNVRQGGAAGSAVLNTTTAGATTVSSLGTAQSVTLTPSTSGTVKVTGGTDPTKIVSIDASGNTTAVTETLAFGATTARTATFPDASITVSGAVSQNCGTTTTCSATADSSTVKIVHGQAALSGASPAVAVITGISPAFTSATTYSCGVTVVAAAANTKVLAVTNVSGSAVTFYGPNAATDVVHYVCIGN